MSRSSSQEGGHLLSPASAAQVPRVPDDAGIEEAERLLNLRRTRLYLLGHRAGGPPVRPYRSFECRECAPHELHVLLRHRPRSISISTELSSLQVCREAWSAFVVDQGGSGDIYGDTAATGPSARRFHVATRAEAVCVGEPHSPGRSTRRWRRSRSHRQAGVEGATASPSQLQAAAGCWNRPEVDGCAARPVLVTRHPCRPRAGRGGEREPARFGPDTPRPREGRPTRRGDGQAAALRRRLTALRWDVSRRPRAPDTGCAQLPRGQPWANAPGGEPLLASIP